MDYNFIKELELGRIEPITYWKDKVSKWDYSTQTQFYISLLGIVRKEEREGRINGSLYKYAFHLANVISNQSNIQKQLNKEKQPVEIIKIPLLPHELSSPEAMLIWEKAKNAGWINEDYTFNGTRYQQAYAAELMGKSLKLRHKWKPFISLWGYKYFPQTRRDSIENIGKVDRDKEIEEAFSL